MNKNKTYRRDGSKRQRNMRRSRVPRPLASPDAPAIKYFDTLVAANTTTTVGYNLLTGVPQNVGQSCRIADTIFVRKVDVVLVVLGSTTDITSQMRWAIFNWIPNTNGVTPGTSSYFEDAATFGVLTPLNFEGRRDYNTLLGGTITLVGTSTNPTPTFMVKRNYTIRKRFRIDYNVGTTTGYNHLFWTNFSDSIASPHPSYRVQTRVWYTDTY